MHKSVTGKVVPNAMEVKRTTEDQEGNNYNSRRHRVAYNCLDGQLPL